MVSPNPNDTEHLDAARAGNPESFNALVEPYRKALLVHCYRMSGTLEDAEDLVQETFLRAWNKLDIYKGQGSFRNWLYVIATRLCLDEIRKRKKQVLLPLDGDPANPDLPPEPMTTGASWLDPLPGTWLSTLVPSPESSYERRETISLAFMTALHSLNARQRVVLILREVYGWSAKEVADTLELSVDSVNNLLYRARKNLKVSNFAEETATKDQLDHFVDAWESGDLDSLIRLLHEKATFAMPPMNVWYLGRESIRRALQNFVFVPNVDWKLIRTSANGHPAFGIYRSEGQAFEAFGLLVPIFSRGRIMGVTTFLAPLIVTKFGLDKTVSG